MLGLPTRLLRQHAGLLGFMLGAAGTLTTEVGKNCGDERHGGKYRAGGRDLSGARCRTSRREFAFLLLREQPLGGLACLTLLTQVAACLDDPTENIVSQLDTADIESLFDAQETSVHEHGERAGLSARLGESLDEALL
ncbi:MAG TPA: hypothetical protein VI195_01110, partial [Steroidobacteraceae bacterium]